MIAEDFPPVCAGVGHYIYALSRQLAQRGHEVTVLTRGSWSRTTKEFADGLTVYRVRFIRSYPLHIQPHGVFVNRLVKQLEPGLDIVHIHGPMAPAINTRLPVVLTQHGTAKASIGHLRLLDLFSLGAKSFSWMYEGMDRAATRRATSVTTVSEACAEELRRYCDVKNVVIIGNGVDTSFFTPSNGLARKPEAPIVAYVGILNSRKGIPDLVASAPRVLQAVPDAQFLLAGTGPMEGYLRRKVHELGVDRAFGFLGYLDRPQLRELYQRAHVLVLPSYHEGLPNVVLEGMACGTPVIATAIPGTVEAVEDGQVGLLVPPHDPPGLADAIVKLLRDEPLRMSMGARAREHVESTFDWRIVADRVERLYQAVLR